MTETEKNEFIQRFTEVCGTTEPADVQRLLNISYQGAKNYLLGRFPDAAVLRTIARKTPYSIHWLLTGKGEKLVSDQPATGTPLAIDQFRALVRQECVEVINEALGSQITPQPKVAVLQSGKLRSEKVRETVIFANKQELGTDR
ncbi:MAG: hypothetical protein H7070_06165 [Saprospiraceae bacterium]|nr:hypothetical protein [Pyrinomonadaceae bacterium]